MHASGSRHSGPQGLCCDLTIEIEAEGLAATVIAFGFALLWARHHDLLASKSVRAPRPSVQNGLQPPLIAVRGQVRCWLFWGRQTRQRIVLGQQATSFTFSGARRGWAVAADQLRGFRGGNTEAFDQEGRVNRALRAAARRRQRSRCGIQPCGAAANARHPWRPMPAPAGRRGRTLESLREILGVRRHAPAAHSSVNPRS
jgi:hypothetical protein